jgi:SAM-dependent methyltransferase
MLSLAFPQSAVRPERGYQLDGHLCLTEVDERISKQLGGSLLYGEVLPAGVAKLVDDTHLMIDQATVVYDFGAGTGKLAVQCFFQYPHLQKVVAVEISPSRYKFGVVAFRRLAKLRGMALIADNDFECILIDVRGNTRRTLEFKCCDVFDGLEPTSRLAAGDAGYVKEADIIFLNTDFPDFCTRNLCRLFNAMRHGTRTATYSDVRKPYSRLAKEAKLPAFPLTQLSSNVNLEDKFQTTWSEEGGHHFHCFVKGSMPVVKTAKGKK